MPDHLVIVSDDDQTIRIFRVRDGKKAEIVHEIRFSDAETLGESPFLKLLAENILLDSEAGRRLLDLIAGR